MELDAIFELGKVLLDELRDRHIIQLEGDRISQHAFYKWESFKERMENGINLFSRIYRCVTSWSDLSRWQQWEDIERISFWYYPSPILFAPSCNKLSTILNTASYRLDVLPDNFFENMKNVRVLSLWDSKISSLPSSLVFLGNTLKMLDLQRCRNCHKIPVSYLTALRKLEVLDLSDTSLQEFPDNFFQGLQSLRFLDLSKCPSLFSLPPSISCLLNLEQLLLSECQNLRALPSSVQPLEKLKLLDLSRTAINEIPEQFFMYMAKLKDLNLSYNTFLKSLPTSIARLVSLKKLNLKDCSSISPSLQHLPSSLEELDLSGCKSLQDVKQISSSFRDRLPNLRALDLSGTPVNFISLRNHSRLETLALKSNADLDVLDLSGTPIQNFTLEGASELKGVSRLDLLGVKHLCKVNWERINRLPQAVNWDQCGDGSMSHMDTPLAEWRRNGNGRGVFISVGNANIFRTLSQSHSWIKGRFFVYVCPCTERGKKKALPSQRSHYRYKDVIDSMMIRPSMPSMPSYERWLGIERVDKFPKDISAVLSQAQFLSLRDEKVIVQLSDLGIGNMGELRECWMENCEAMKVLFDIGANDLAKHQPVLRCLEKLRISKLMKLTNICISSGILKDGSFGNLKHLQLEYCPRVVTIFSSAVCLESLEVLEIKFCARLEEIFSAKVNEEGSLRRLHTLCLLELPALKNIAHNLQLASLKKANVKGCPELRKLPLHSNKMDFSLVVTGESKWWEQLEWEDKNAKQHISFNSWKPFRLPK